MQTTPFRLSLLALSLATAFIFMACNRRDKDKDSDTSLAADHALSENVYHDAVNMADEASDKSTGDHLSSYKTASNCATVTHDTLSTPKSITIDFGAVNCLCNDGKNRRGKILITYTGHYRDSGSVHNIAFDNFYVNDNHIMGTKTVTNMGKNSANQSYFSIQVNGLIVKAITNDTISWTSNRVRTWIQGESTPVRLDDVYQITGSASGTKGGNSYTATIIQPLVKAVDCDYISAGVQTIQVAGKLPRSIDYGNGSCDNTAQVTIGSNVFTITLH